MTWPAACQIKPEPLPLGTEKTLRVQKSTTCSWVLMNTTEPLDRSKMSTVAFSCASSSPRGVTTRGAALSSQSQVIPLPFHSYNFVAFYF